MVKILVEDLLRRGPPPGSSPQTAFDANSEPSQPTDYLSDRAPPPLATAHIEMAARLRALAPKSSSRKDNREALCRMLHRVERDPAVLAIAEQLAAGYAPAREYALSDRILITEDGARFAVGTQRFNANMLSLLNAADAFPVEQDCSPAELVRLEASVTQRIAIIAADLIAHLTGQSEAS